MLKKILQGLLIGAGAAAVALALWYGRVLERWEYVTWNMRVSYFAPKEKPSDQVKVILIDQSSLDWGKKESAWPWPWPRVVYGPIIDFCRRAGARVVAFDMLYTEPSILGVSDDEDLGAALQRSPPFVGTVVLGNDVGSTTNWPEEIAKPNLHIEGMEDWLKNVNRGRLEEPTALFPIPEVATNVTMLSNVMDVPDRDGIFRRANMFRVFDGEVVPSMGLATWLVGRDAAEKAKPITIERGWLQVGGRKVPIDRWGRTILHYKGQKGFHESYSAAAVIQSELRLQNGEKPPLDPAVFKDCYVLLGPSAPALLDLRSTPLSKVAPGVEHHATVLDSMLTGQFIRDVPRRVVFWMVLVLSLFSAVVVTLCRTPWQSVLAFVVLLPIPLLAGFGAYNEGWWLQVVVGEIGVALAVVGAVVVNYVTEGRQKAFIKQAFKFYLSPEVIEDILVNPDQLKLGGEKRTLTLFFSDIEKFSSFSERLDPPTLTALLNDCLSDMTDIILEEGGTLDKYIGDAIVAFWNAPLSQGDHAQRAVRAALRCQRKLAERRKEFQDRTGALVKMRIGLNTGDVVVGNMGSRERFNYTVLGDAANLASRLEGANKAFGTYMMASESTWSLVKDSFVGRELGRLRVVGRQTPVRVFQPVALPGEPVPEWFKDFELGLSLCYQGQWAQAMEAFSRCPEDPAAKVYMEKCSILMSEGSATWDGVWNLTEK
jgi:adenylate cyclase